MPANLRKLFAAIRAKPRQRFCLLAGVILLGLGSYGGWRYLRTYHFEPMGHWRAAQRALAHRDFPEALTRLKICAQAWPEDAATRFLLARTARRAGELALALEQLAACERLVEKK